MKFAKSSYPACKLSKHNKSFTFQNLQLFCQQLFKHILTQAHVADWDDVL